MDYATAIKIVDNLPLFFDIHLERYYDKQGRNIINSEEVFIAVLETITQAWDHFIAPRGRDLLRMTLAEKMELFRSVNLEYTKRFISANDVSLLTEDASNDSSKDEMTPGEKDFSEKIQRAFWFLPVRWRERIILAPPALEAVGIDINRFREIFNGSPISDDEKELFEWSYGILEALSCAHKMQGTQLEKRLVQEALDTAREKLDGELADLVIRSILNLFEELSQGDIH